MSDTKLLSKSISLEIFGNKYEVFFPNTGQFIDIQTIKSKMTEDRLEAFKLLERDGLFAHIFVETIATFNVLIPQLRKDLNCGLLGLEFDRMVDMATVYKDVFSPWFESWLGILSQPKKKDETAPSKETANA